MTRKVIYICFGRLTDKMARDWYIDFLISRGVEVEYWDIVALVREEHTEGGALHATYLRIFRSFRELERAVCMPENRDACYIMLLSYSGKLTRVFRMLSRYQCRMLYFAWGAMPKPAHDWRRILAWAATPRRVAREALYRCRALFLQRTGRIAPFEIVFAAGAVSVATTTNALRVVPVNYFDYDHYVQAKTAHAEGLPSGRYAVFLDCNLPYHSDLAYSGYPSVDARHYYCALNEFFGRLERRHDIQVVIAAHPRASYSDARFEGRAMHRMVTAALVRDAEFVLSHWSTATSYAVLNGKPLAFIYTDEMARIYARSLMRLMRAFAQALDAPLCKIDEPGAAERLVIGPPNAARYTRYKYDYLTSPQSEDTSTEDIFWRELSSLAGASLPTLAPAPAR